MDRLWPLLAAPFVGSFLGVLIARLPEGRPIALARSACDQCGAPIAPYDLVPLLSHLVLRGRCRRCRAPIAARHWHVELAALAVALTAVVAGHGPARTWCDCGFGWTLLALAWIDHDTMRLPDALTLPLVPAGLLATLWLDPAATTDHAVAAALAYIAFRALGWAYRRARGREGLGQGDAKLLAAIAAWVGIDGLAPTLLIAAVAGLVWAGLLGARGRTLRPTTAIAFGPCLALAGLAVRLHPSLAVLR